MRDHWLLGTKHCGLEKKYVQVDQKAKLVMSNELGRRYHDEGRRAGQGCRRQKALLYQSANFPFLDELHSTSATTARPTLADDSVESHTSRPPQDLSK